MGAVLALLEPLAYAFLMKDVFRMAVQFVDIPLLVLKLAQTDATQICEVSVRRPHHLINVLDRCVLEAILWMKLQNFDW